MPAGTRYVVTEMGKQDGYTPSVTVIENGTNTVNETAKSDTEEFPLRINKKPIWSVRMRTK